MNLFDNAISSVRMGIEDFSSNNDDRLLSAVRNLHSGILLLYKQKLAELSPKGSNDVLIKKNIRPIQAPDGGIAFVGQGNKTVDVIEIQERFSSLGIKTDWERFNRINRLRNEIEHHFTTLNQDAIKGMISDTFIIIRDFIRDELNADAMMELGSEAWSVLLSVSEVFETERTECQARLESVDWKSDTLSAAVMKMPCGNCGSPLVAAAGADRNDGVECRSCGETENFEGFAERALREDLGWKNHRSIQDGGEEVLVNCPFCFQEGYVVEEKQCAICGENCCHTCEFCSNEIPTCELSDGSLCGWCDHMVNKDD